MTPPIEDAPLDAISLPISIRAFAEEVAIVGEYDEDGDADHASAKTHRRKKAGSPDKWTLVFDTETTIDPSQRLRVGAYQLYEYDRLDEEGLFYDHLTSDELTTLDTYCAEHLRASSMTVADFRLKVLIQRGFEIGATIVTFNGPFDFARVAISASAAHGYRKRRKMRGGFSFKFDDRDYYPSLQIKTLNPRTSLMELTAPRPQETARSQRKKSDPRPTFRGFFVDVKTLAAALTTRSHSLSSLTKALKTPTQKEDNDDHGEVLSSGYLDYARSDVRATWECYCVLRAKYRSYGLNAPVTDILSEASIGKSALETIGIKPWLKVHPGGLDAAQTSLTLSTYFGGRTETRTRRKMVRVIHTDFTSMYPTVCTAQNLFPFVIGDGFTQTDATPEIRAFVDAATPDDFQKLENWPKLTALIRIIPDRDLVPIRAAYPGQKHDTIGLNFLTYRGSLWITLADCLAAKFLLGKAPKIEEAIQFAPGPPQPGLKPIKLMGLDPIDPYSQDFYRELICARQRLEREKEGKSEAEQAEIEGAREFLKIVANSTSYGIFVQVNVSAEPRGAWIDVHRPDGSHFRKKMTKVETLGPWFNPLVATLITGGARLMLALAEYQVLVRGLDWAFCDTDSIAIAKPDNMADDDFVDRCLGPNGVVEWFRPLNPYGIDEPILKVEKVNYAASGPKQLAPLYCWAISSKRYALFNVTGNGKPTIRKASAHGLGHLRSPYKDKDALTCFPTPLKSVLSGKEKLQRWHYDVWCAILTAVLAGKPDTVKFVYHPALKDPTVSRYTATSPKLLNWFKKLNDEKPYSEAIKPYGFLFTLHLKKRLHPDLNPDPILRGKKASDVFPVAPFYRDLKIAISKAFDRVTNAPIDAALLETYAEALSEYPFRSENKFSNGEYKNFGTTERRHIFATDINLIGKEADHWEQEYYLGIRNGDVTVTYGGDPVEGSRAYVLLRNAIAAFGKFAVHKATGIARATLAKLERGEDAKTNVPHWKILKAIDQLNKGRSAKLREADVEHARLMTAKLLGGGIRGGARLLGIDPSNFAKRLKLNEP